MNSNYWILILALSNSSPSSTNSTNSATSNSISRHFDFDISNLIRICLTQSCLWRRPQYSNFQPLSRHLIYCCATVRFSIVWLYLHDWNFTFLLRYKNYPLWFYFSERANSTLYFVWKRGLGFCYSHIEILPYFAQKCFCPFASSILLSGGLDFTLISYLLSAKTICLSSFYRFLCHLENSARYLCLRPHFFADWKQFQKFVAQGWKIIVIELLCFRDFLNSE